MDVHASYTLKAGLTGTLPIISVDMKKAAFNGRLLCGDTAYPHRYISSRCLLFPVYNNATDCAWQETR